MAIALLIVTRNETETIMTRATIQDWTDTAVVLSGHDERDVKYQVYREGEINFLDMRSANDDPIHTLELPDGMLLDTSSYEVLLRYVLLDIVAA
jgi:hypothetical protein